MRGSREHPGGASNLRGEWRGGEQGGVREAFMCSTYCPSKVSGSQPGGETRGRGDKVNTGKEVGRQPDSKDRRQSRQGWHRTCALGVARDGADWAGYGQRYLNVTPQTRPTQENGLQVCEELTATPPDQPY